MVRELFVMVLLPCVSPVQHSMVHNETIVQSCPETVHFVWRSEGLFVNPREYARLVHLTDGHRDDRSPTEVTKVSPTKKAAAKSKSRKKGKRKRGKA